MSRQTKTAHQIAEMKAIQESAAEQQTALEAARAARPPVDPTDVVGAVRDALPEMVRKLVAIASGDSKTAGMYVRGADALAATKQLAALAERLGVLPTAPAPDEASADGTPASPVVPGRISMSRQITAIRKPPQRAEGAPALRVVGGEKSA